MDILNSAILSAKAKAQAQRSTGSAGDGKTYLSQGEIRRQEVEAAQAKQKELDDKEQERENKRLKKLVDFFGKDEKHPNLGGGDGAERSPTSRPTTDDAKSTNDDDDERDAEPPIGVAEIHRRLRKLGKPIIFFAETPIQRYRRLCKHEVSTQDDGRGRRRLVNADVDDDDSGAWDKDDDDDDEDHE
eukprot:Selendium_serpulae@DN10_c0_g1_i1.p1